MRWTGGGGGAIQSSKWQRFHFGIRLIWGESGDQVIVAITLSPYPDSLLLAMDTYCQVGRKGGPHLGRQSPFEQAHTCHAQILVLAVSFSTPGHSLSPQTYSRK